MVWEQPLFAGSVQQMCPSQPRGLIHWMTAFLVRLANELTLLLAIVQHVSKEPTVFRMQTRVPCVRHIARSHLWAHRRHPIASVALEDKEQAMMEVLVNYVVKDSTPRSRDVFFAHPTGPSHQTQPHRNHNALHVMMDKSPQVLLVKLAQPILTRT